MLAHGATIPPTQSRACPISLYFPSKVLLHYYAKLQKHHEYFFIILNSWISSFILTYSNKLCLAGLCVSEFWCSHLGLSFLMRMEQICYMEIVNHFRGCRRRLEDPPTLLACTYDAAIPCCAISFCPSTELFEDSWLNANLIIEFTFHKWFKQFKMNLTWLFNLLTKLCRLFVLAGGSNGWG